MTSGHPFPPKSKPWVDLRICALWQSFLSSWRERAFPGSFQSLGPAVLQSRFRKWLLWKQGPLASSTVWRYYPLRVLPWEVLLVGLKLLHGLQKGKLIRKWGQTQQSMCLAWHLWASGQALTHEQLSQVTENKLKSECGPQSNPTISAKKDKIKWKDFPLDQTNKQPIAKKHRVKFALL